MPAPQTSPQKVQTLPPPEYRPFRLEVDGTLVLTAPLHIGGGAQWSPGMDAPLFMEDGKTPIPGTSLRGILRHHLLREHGLLGLDAAALDRLLGKISPAGTEDGVGMASRLRVFDAVPQGAESPPVEVRDYTRHQPETAAAAHRGKFDAEVVLPTPNQTYSFRLLYEGQSADDPELDLVREALRALEDGELRVGAHSGKGMGKIKLQPGYRLRSFQRTEPAGLAAFLRHRAGGADPERPFQFRKVSPPVCPSLYPPQSRLQWSGILQFDGPMLIRAAIPPEPDPASAEQPDQVSVIRASDGAYYLPGASLRGALRAQAHRICRALGVPAVEEVLFGCAKGDSEASWKGCLEVGDGELDDKAARIYLDHVALDRITQFPVDGAKFSVSALASPRFRVSFRLLATREQQAAVALWRFLQRDLEAGRIWVGGGVTRGYGRLLSATFPADQQSHSLVHQDWPSLRESHTERGRVRLEGGWCRTLDQELTSAWQQARLAHNAPVDQEASQ